MAKTITRQLLKLFGGAGSSTNFTQFGSTVAGSTLRTKNIPLIQALDAYINGWQDAVVPASKAPFLEDMNGVVYLLCYQLAYLFQDGIPEWQTDTTYFIGSIVRKPDTSELFMSLTNDNQGNALPSPASTTTIWKYLRFGIPVGSVVDFTGASIPDGYLLCDGSAVSRTTYADLFAVIGTTWGAGDGSTTFNVPGLRGKTTFGVDIGNPAFTTLATTGGQLTHTHSQPAHTHDIPDHDHALLNTGTVQSPVTGGSPLRSAPGKGSQLYYNATFGVGAQQNQVTNQTSTVVNAVTVSAQPAIGNTDLLPPYATVYKIIKF